MNHTVRKADRNYRKKTFTVIAVCILAGIAVLIFFYNYINDIKILAKQDPATAFQQMFQILQIVLSLMSVSLIALGGFIAHLSFRTIQTSEFPPPHVKVIRDTQIITGQRAKRRGIIGIIIAAAIILSALTFPWLFYKNMEKAFYAEPLQTAPLQTGRSD